MAFSLKLELPSHPMVLSVVRRTVEQFATVVGFSDEDCRHIVLAVDEAVANVIRHAYHNRHDQEIELTCRRLRCETSAGDVPDGLEFILVDHGQAADPEKLKGRPLDEVRPGGLGMHFIRNFMDEVNYEPLPDRNQLRLVKTLGKK